MDKKDYISNIFRKILKEDLEEKAESLMNKLDRNKKTNLYNDNEFDYVEEGKSMCESCGGEMKEGENCENCGGRRGKEIMELGGMDDGHPKFGKMKFGKMSSEEIERLLRGDDDDADDDENDYGNLSMYNPYYDDEGENGSEYRGSEGYDDASDRYTDKKSIRTRRRDYEGDMGEGVNLEIDDDEYDDFEFETPVRNAMRSHKGKFETPVRNAMRSHKGKFETPVRNAMRSRGNRLRDIEDDMSESVNFEIDEKLYGNQYKLDKDKNSRINKKDFEMMGNKEVEEQLYEIDFEKEENTEGNAFTGALSNAKKRNEDEFEVDGKKFKVKESILYTESDLLDLIENLVIEEKNTFKKSEPKGYKEYERVHNADKKENDNYLKSVAKKMTDYLKGSSDSGSKYEMKVTKKFPTENGGMKKGIRKKYTPSDAVDDYVDAFSYPGQTNLRFNDIKPNSKNIEKYLKGDRTTGNAQVDDDGNALGNVVPSDVGEKFFKNFEENLYGHEQADASYKRYSQPVDFAGEDIEKGSLKSKKGKGKKTAQTVLDNIDESVEPKKLVKLNEEFGRMQELMGYSRKTQ